MAIRTRMDTGMDGRGLIRHTHPSILSGRPSCALRFPNPDVLPTPDERKSQGLAQLSSEGALS